LCLLAWANCYLDRGSSLIPSRYLDLLYGAGVATAVRGSACRVHAFIVACDVVGSVSATAAIPMVNSFGPAAFGVSPGIGAILAFMVLGAGGAAFGHVVGGVDGRKNRGCMLWISG